MTASGASASALDKGTRTGSHSSHLDKRTQARGAFRHGGENSYLRETVGQPSTRSNTGFPRRFLGGFPVGAPIPTLLPRLGWACRNSSTSLHYPRNLAQ